MKRLHLPSAIVLFFATLFFAENNQAQTIDVDLTVTPDCWGYETSWQLMNGTTVVLEVDQDTYDSGFPSGPWS